MMVEFSLLGILKQFNKLAHLTKNSVTQKITLYFMIEL